jgi:hypothetical protein
MARIWYNIYMSGRKKAIPRAKMPAGERDRRSRLARLAHGAGLLRGTLLLRERVCGKPNCRCVKGHKHRALYVVASKKGRLRQLYVPQAWEARVRQWVAQYREAKRLLDEVSELYWDKVRNRQE